MPENELRCTQEDKANDHPSHIYHCDDLECPVHGERNKTMTEPICSTRDVVHYGVYSCGDPNCPLHGKRIREIIDRIEKAKDALRPTTDEIINLVVDLVEETIRTCRDERRPMAMSADLMKQIREAIEKVRAK